MIQLTELSGNVFKYVSASDCTIKFCIKITSFRSVVPIIYIQNSLTFALNEKNKQKKTADRVNARIAVFEYTLFILSFILYCQYTIPIQDCQL